jgi:hypothetical protein
MFDARKSTSASAGARGAAVGAVLVAALLMAASASASTTLCVKDAANGAVQGPTTVGGSACETGYNAIALPGATELAALDEIMPHVKYEAAGVGGKPTIEFSGVNVQVVDGAGETDTTNGEGNLVIGYDENYEKHSQTGSHNLILGFEQTFTSFGGIVGGYDNTITGPYASVTGGSANIASEDYASVGGGYKNTASGEYAVIAGGRENKASGNFSALLGGKLATVTAANEAKL